MNDLPDFIANPKPEIYLSDNYIIADFETTNLDKGNALNPSNRLILACARLGRGHPESKRYPRGYTHWGSEFEQSRLIELIQNAQFVIGHNLKFEYGWLARSGYDLRSALGYDTMLGEYVLAGNRKWELGLDATAKRYGVGGKSRLVSSLIKGGVCPSEIPANLLESYCERDCITTEAVFQIQRQRLRKHGLLQILYQRCLVTPVLADIERHGLSLDTDIVKEKYNEYTAKFVHANARFTELAGGRNPRSSKQMGQFLYGGPAEGGIGFQEITDRHGNILKTVGGRYRTDGPSIACLEASTPEQKRFKAVCAEISKLKVPVQNLQKMQDVLNSGETLVRARFNQAVTQTHRLSSSGSGVGGFQFHNFDRAFKRCFRARANEGWSMVEADAPQLEFRVAGFLGQDKHVFQSVSAGEDVHAFTASIVGCSRQGAKAHTFKPLYGGQSGTRKEKAYYKAFREKYDDLYKTQQSWTYEVAGNPEGRLVTDWGLRFYWPGTTIASSGYVNNTPSIFNYPIQSLATADIIPLTLVMIWHRMRNMQGFIVNTIHDSVIAEVPDSELQQYKDIIVRSFTVDIFTMLKRLYNLDFNIPLGVTIKAAPHWGEGQEELHNGTG